MDETEPEDEDLTLQKDSQQKLSYIKTSLPFFLWKKRNPSHASRVRRHVRQRHVARYEEIFNRFQEWPQLLDPILESLVTSLVSALLESLRQYTANHPVPEFRREEVFDHVDTADLLGNVFDRLLRFLGDMDNPVRFASSKALSIISQKLDLEMTEQLVDAIIERLQENIIESAAVGELPIDSYVPYIISSPCDFSTADATQWHGLILTLSHLLFRRSAPRSKLITVVNLLMQALHFHQASSIVASRDATVRDAACFGIWSLARKYSTEELLQIPAEMVWPRSSENTPQSTISMLAAELTATATLDSEGNIRRGASAALQELVGRHPDSVPFGISLIQLVDYHAVGLRKRAMLDISAGAAAFGRPYLDGIVRALLSWRALASSDRRARCDAATTLATVVERVDLTLIDTLVQKFHDARFMSIEERHGISLALAWSLNRIRTFKIEGPAIECVRDGDDCIFNLTTDAPFADYDMTDFSSRRNLVIEGQCEMTNTLLNLSSGRCLDGPLPVKSTLTLRGLRPHRLLLEMSLKYAVEIDMQTLVGLGRSLCNKLMEDDKIQLLHDWMTVIEQGRFPGGGGFENWIAVAGSVLGCLGRSQKSSEVVDMLSLTRKVLVSQLSSAHGVETTQIDQALLDCLDDYTITAQGDVGSNVRIQALKMLNAGGIPMQWSGDDSMQILGRICGLAVEKLDKVRHHAWDLIRNQKGLGLPQDQNGNFALSVWEHLATPRSSDVEHFAYILNISNRPPLRHLAMRGFVTSAGVGHDEVIYTARTALLNFLDLSSSEDVSLFYQALVQSTGAEPYDGRLIRPLLEVLAFLFEYTDFRQAENSPLATWQQLLSHLPILHKSTDIPTLEAIVRIYAALAHHADLKEKAYSSLSRLLLHRYIAVRLAAASALCLDQPPNEVLKALDLQQAVPTLRTHVKAAMGIGHPLRDPPPEVSAA
ncbi:MAG: hypothetical protein Q9220_005506 [cf. Caloplaca sp. 1 TL-2023]